MLKRLERADLKCYDKTMVGFLSERSIMNSQKKATGNLVVKNGYWHARLLIKTEDGEYKQIWRTTKLPVKNNKRKAKAFLQELIDAYNSENGCFYSNMTVAEYFTLWLKIIKEEVRANTYRTYKGNMENHIIPYFQEKGIRLQELKPCDLSEFYMVKHTTNSKMKKDEALSSTTIQHFHQNISKALNDAVERGYINYNPDVASKRPKIKNYNASFLNQKQIQVLLNLLEGSLIYLPVLICSIYGMRRSEVLGIKWCNVDFVNNTIHIYETLQQSTKALTGDSNYTDDPKNKCSKRTMPLIPLIREKLLAQKQWQLSNKKEYEELYIESDYVFTLENGAVIKPNYLSKNFRKFADKAGFERVRFHDLRHSVASNLLNKGFSYVQTADWLGHSTPSTTFRYYAHVDKSSRMAIAADYERAFEEQEHSKNSEKIVETGEKIVDIREYQEKLDESYE